MTQPNLNERIGETLGTLYHLRNSAPAIESEFAGGCDQPLLAICDLLVRCEEAGKTPLPRVSLYGAIGRTVFVRDLLSSEAGYSESVGLSDLYSDRKVEEFVWILQETGGARVTIDGIEPGHVAHEQLAQYPIHPNSAWATAANAIVAGIRIKRA